MIIYITFNNNIIILMFYKFQQFKNYMIENKEIIIKNTSIITNIGMFEHFFSNKKNRESNEKINELNRESNEKICDKFINNDKLNRESNEKISNDNIKNNIFNNCMKQYDFQYCFDKFYST